MNLPLLKGSFTLGAADFSRKLLLAATVLLCARFLPPRTFGDYIFLLSFYQIVAFLAGAGLPSSLLRAVARSERNGLELACASMLARVAYVLPASAIMFVGIWLMGLLSQYSVALVMMALMMATRGAAENITYIFQGNEDQISCAKVGVSQSVVTLLLTLVICLSTKNLVMLIGAHVLGGFVSAAYGFVLLEFKVNRHLRFGSMWEDTKFLFVRAAG